MITDAFTAAASAEAEARFPRAADGRVPQDRWPFKIGAVWARDHLAAHDARVRRDAAREALDGLAGEANHVDWEMDGPSFALRVRRFKNRNYPEEAPND